MATAASSIPSATLVDLQYRLSSPSLFAADPLPSTHDPFTPLFVRYFPPTNRPKRRTDGHTDDTPDVEGSTESLRAQRRWRALADQTARRIVQSRENQEASLRNIHSILQLWILRFSCLQRLHFLAILSNECGTLNAILPPSHPATSGAHQRVVNAAAAAAAGEGDKAGDDGRHDEPYFHPILPFPYILFRASLPLFLGGDQYTMVRNLRQIAHGCRQEGRRTMDASWKTRELQTNIMLANILAVLNQHQQAARLLKDLRAQWPERQDIRDALFLVLVDMGNVNAAEALLTEQDRREEGVQGTAHEPKVGEDSSMHTLLLASQGKWKGAGESARRVHSEADNGKLPSVNNKAVLSLYNSKRQEALRLLDDLRDSASFEFFNNETYVSNLITLQELGSGDQTRAKLDLVSQASGYSSEGFRVECFKL